MLECLEFFLFVKTLALLLIDFLLVSLHRPRSSCKSCDSIISNGKINRYILSVAGGSQHTVILAWNPNLPDNFKRSQAVLEIEQQEDVLSSTALLNEESNKPSRLDSPSKIDLETRSEMNISPRAKRPKLCFSRDVVERCLQEVKKLEKTVWNTGLNRDKAIENLPSLCD